MNHSESLSKLTPALIKALAEIKPATMDSSNKFLGNRYASLGSVIETARPVLAKHDLGITQMVISDDFAGTRIGVETVLWHASGEWISGTVTMEMPDEASKGRSAAQEAGAIITYLRRYGLSGILNIYAEEDTDGTAPTQAPARTSTPARTRTPDPVEAKAEPKPANGNQAPSRPYTPEQVKIGLEKLAHEYPRQNLSDKQRNLLRYGLDLCFAGSDPEDLDAKRHAVLEYLTGDPSTRTVNPSIGKAMMDGWLKITKDEATGDYQVDGTAAKEALRIYNQSLIDDGQQILDI